MSPVRFVMFVLVLASTETMALAQAAVLTRAPIARRTDTPGPACFTGKEQIGELSYHSCFRRLYVSPDGGRDAPAKQIHLTGVEFPGEVWLFTIPESAGASTSGPFIAELVRQAMTLRATEHPLNGQERDTESGNESFGAKDFGSLGEASWVLTRRQSPGIHRT